MLEQLRRFEPHVGRVFRPEIVPAGRSGERAAPVLGFLTEPLPRAGCPIPTWSTISPSWRRSTAATSTA